MTDRPDFETDTNISSQTVGELAVEVAAQTVNQLAVDIEAQTVSDLGVDIQTQSLGEQDTAVTTERSKEIVFLDEFQTDTVADNESETVLFTPPPGTLFRARSVQFFVNATGGGGTHSLSVGTDGGVGAGFLVGEFDGVDDIDVNESTFENQSAAVSVGPATQAAQVASVNALVADNDNPVEFTYSNFTGADETAGRTYSIIAEQINIA
jgi:hypothetical protein